MNHLIVIDDTGSPGNPSESKTLKNDRKTFVAVFISATQREKVKNDIRLIQKSFSNESRNISELHFTDIINRRSEFKNLKREEVFSLFSTFTQFTKQLSLGIMVQTATERTLAENGMSFLNQLQSKENQTPEMIALNLIIIRICDFLKENNIKEPIDIFIDEGIKKAGEKISFGNFWTCNNPYEAKFESSHIFLPLQLADFYAYSINRMQMLSIKDKVTDFDIGILNLISSSLESKKISGLTGRMVDVKNFSKEKYDEVILEKFKEHGNLDFWKSINEKN